jgi:hypothetical protein
MVSEQNCDDTIEAVKIASENLPRRTKADGARYLGSAPIIVAQIWAKLCGAAPGTREFAEYARKQLSSGEYAKLKVHLGA